MEKILNEKKSKYNDTWKTANLSFLIGKLKEQLDSIDIISLRRNISKEKTKRKLIHISNYCFFLYTRINEIEGG